MEQMLPSFACVPTWACVATSILLYLAHGKPLKKVRRTKLMLKLPVLVAWDCP
jgi:hypothetical protein